MICNGKDVCKTEVCIHGDSWHTTDKSCENLFCPVVRNYVFCENLENGEKMLNVSHMNWATPKVKICKISKDAKIPKYESAGASGMDLVSTEDIEIKPLERVLVPTGLIIEIPQGYEGQIRARSGLAIKNGIAVLNGVGTIDCDYRAEVKVILFNTSHKETFTVAKGMRVAQLVIAPSITVQIEEVNNFKISKTKRGENGFGSTGHF